MEGKIMRYRLLFGLIILIIGATVGHAAATWEAQVSTSETILNDVYFTDPANGWAVGDNGLILRTANRGKTWTAEASGTTADLKAVHFYSATDGWAVGTALTIVKYNGTGWTAGKIPASAAPADLDLWGLHMTGANSIWVAAPGFTTGGGITKFRNFFHSSDGGVSWEYKIIQNTAEAASIQNYFYGTFFLDDNTGWVVGINNATSPTGKIFKTTDGAVSWQDVSPSGAAAVEFRDIYFSDAQHGWAVGGVPGSSEGAIYSSTDGGLNWTASSQTFKPALFSRISADGSGGLWLANYSRPSLFNYDAASGSWSENSLLATSDHFTSVYFADPWNGWAVGGINSVEGGGVPKRYIYKYVIEPANLKADRAILISTATYELTPAFYGNNIESNALLTLEAAAGLTLLTDEVSYDPVNKRNKINATVSVDPAVIGGSYHFYVLNPDEGTSGLGSFIVQEPSAPAEKPVATAVPAKVFDPAVDNTLKLQVSTLPPVTASKVRAASVTPGVLLDLYVYQVGTHQIVYHIKFPAPDTGITTFNLSKVTDLGLDISDGIYRAEVFHPTFGKIGSGQIVVHHSK